MKKRFITALTTSVLLVFGTATAAFAETAPANIQATGSQNIAPVNNDKNKPGEVDITADVKASYVVKIPTNIDFKNLTRDPSSNDGTADLKMELTDNTGFSAVNVSISNTQTDGKYLLTRTDGRSTIGYTIDNPISKLTLNKEETCQVVVDKNTIKDGGHFQGKLQFQFDGVES